MQYQYLAMAWGVSKQEDEQCSCVNPITILYSKRGVSSDNWSTEFDEYPDPVQSKIRFISL